MRQESGSSRYRHGLEAMMVSFGCIWGILAIAPVDRLNWWAENLLLLLTFAMLRLGYRWFRFSGFSYGLLGLFLLLHAVGGHYTYPQVPFGYWLQHVFGLARNPYDRLVHFSFGFLLTLPVQEAACRLWPQLGKKAYVLPFVLLLSLSALYEILEMWGSLLLSQEGVDHFLGTQGDPLDSVHDMEFALYGTLLMTLLQLGWNLLRHRDNDKRPAPDSPEIA